MVPHVRWRTAYTNAQGTLRHGNMAFASLHMHVDKEKGFTMHQACVCVYARVSSTIASHRRPRAHVYAHARACARVGARALTHLAEGLARGALLLGMALGVDEAVQRLLHLHGERKREYILD
jgi:hypothetical protein